MTSQGHRVLPNRRRRPGIGGRRLGGLTGSAVVVLVGLGLGATPLLAPRADLGDVSIERAVEHVSVIASEPHPMGTAANARVRDYLIATLAGMQLEPRIQTLEVPDYFGVPGNTVEMTNVMARIGGTESNRAILLMAHYDSVDTTPGANDNAAAVAALLEVGRTLAAHPPPHDVILLFTDGEEPTPRFGASAFKDHPWFDDVGLAVNFEGIGRAGPSLLVEINGPAGALVNRLAGSVEHPAAFSFLTLTTDLIGGAISDFDIFRSTNIPGYSFAYARDSSIYHTHLDAPSTLNVEGMAHHAAIARGITREFGSLTLEPGDSGPVFFTLPGRLVVRYGGELAAGSAMVAVAAIGWVLARRVKRGETSIRRLTRGTGLAFAGSIVIAMAGAGLWLVIGALDGGVGVVEGYIWLVALAAGAAACWHLLWRWSRRSGPDLAGGIGIVWATLAALTGLAAPALSYLFAWPAITASVALAVLFLSRHRVAELAALAVVTLPTAIVLVPAIDTYFQFALPRPGNPDSELLATIVVPLLLVILAVGLIQATLEWAEARRAA